MNFVNALKKEIYKVLTENGDVAYETSGSYCLDYFALIGGLRQNHKECLNLFIKAFFEDEKTALKLLLFTRDIRNGLGERNSFRLILNYLCNFHVEVAEKILECVPKYGRWDDILCAMNTMCEAKMTEIIKGQLTKDIASCKENKNVSLLAKWLPSINTSSKEARKKAKRMCFLLEMTEEEYRKTLSFLRKEKIIENYLRERDYTFEYDKQTSCSMFKYRNAFFKNDNERYNAFLNDVINGKKDLSTKALYPYQVVREIIASFFSNSHPDLTKEQRKALDVTWKNIDRSDIDSKTIVVRDGSGSMYNGATPSANDIATSLAILFAEQLKGPFKNMFISFSNNPRLVSLMGSDIYEVVLNVARNEEISNTDISKVYNLIYKTAKENNLSQEDMIERIVIISDMEFDSCIEGQTTYETFLEKFSSLGYKMPEVVFWNVNSRNTHLPIRMGTNNVKLISGSSNKIIDLVVNSKTTSAYDFMMETINIYNDFD